MKKVLLIISLLLLCGCEKDVYIKNKTIASKNEEIIKDTYKDENIVPISIYGNGENDTLKNMTEDFHTKWIKKKDITVFSVLTTKKDVISDHDYFQNIWEKYASDYESVKYQLGYEISFKLTDKTTIHKTILSPKDVDEFYDYLEIYLYDSAQEPIGKWYSHLLESQMKEDTLMTSIKLTAGSKMDMIDGPITLKAFTYDTTDDFESGFYRGNQIVSVDIYND